MKPNRTKSTVGIVIGGVLFLGAPLYAFLAQIEGMRRAFHTLSESDPGQRVRLTDNISAVLNVYAIATGVAFLGLVVLIVSLVIHIRAGRRPNPDPADRDPYVPGQP